jgi:hypothetical protein
VFAEGIGQLDELSIPMVLRSGPQLQLDPQPTSARQARAFVRNHVTGDDQDLRDSAELVASELVTNGVLHACSTMTLGVVASETCVLIGVIDASETRPAEHQPSMSAEGGRGIALVATIARQWGVQTQDSGKIIWCLIDSESSGAA